MPYKNKEDWIDWNKRRYEESQKSLHELKAKPCTDCGGIFPHYVMEFDHVPERGEKKKNICELSGSSKFTSKRVQEELKKCDLVCANCHKVRTYLRKLDQHSQPILAELPHESAVYTAWDANHLSCLVGMGRG